MGLLSARTRMQPVECCGLVPRWKRMPERKALCLMSNVECLKSGDTAALVSLTFDF